MSEDNRDSDAPAEPDPGPMRIYLSFESGRTGIPYSRGPEEGHSYVNLKLHPEQLDSLPEPSRDRLLKEALVAMNSSGSVLETLGCEVWERDSEMADQSPAYNKGSYISFVFSDERVGNNFFDWCAVFQRFSQALESEREQLNVIKVNCFLKEFAMHDEARRGWQMELWINCFWRTREHATLLWEAMIPLSVNHLLRASAEVHAEVIGQETDSDG